MTNSPLALVIPSSNLFERAEQALYCSCLDTKRQRIAALHRDFGELLREPLPLPLMPAEHPGRPALPLLVSPQAVPKRGLGSPHGRAALIHAIAHIEFNAMNLALDAIYRFQHLPLEYYRDWIQVALEESKHFGLLETELCRLGYSYGAFGAHSGLWDMALLTQATPIARMALVPRLMEARGLDVTPQIIERLKRVGYTQAVEILGVILEEEIGHVIIGNRWFHYLCAEQSVEPIATFLSLLETFAPTFLKPPISREYRQQAGFSPEELDLIESLALA